MEQVFVKVIEQAPTFVGLVVLAWVLYRQNKQLLTALLERIDKLEAEVQTIKHKL